MHDSPELRHPGRPVQRDRVDSSLVALNDLLKGERFGHGTQLPPERELALQLGISRRLLRRVLERLEATGKIWRHRGKGTFVGGRPPSEPTQDPWSDRASNPMEVMEARLELEPTLAALAAVRATSEEVRHIQWCLARSKSATDLETFELWDGTLHRAIALAAHNSLLLAVYDMVNTARSRAFWGRLQDAAVRRSGLETIAQQHHAFVDAVIQRDPAEARRRMHAHITIVRDGMFARDEGIRSDVAAGAELSSA
jgi:DNA-binding FadR family transcriptional regulator